MSVKEKKPSLKKTDMSKTINDVLGLKEAVDFSKLKINDLNRLFSFIVEPSNLVGILARSLRIATKSIAEEKRLKSLLSRPVGDFIKAGEGGILGLGIADRWVAGWRTRLGRK